MTKRPNGCGSITFRGGKFRVRAPAPYRDDLGAYADRGEAESVLRGTIALIAEGRYEPGQRGETVEAYAKRWLEAREGRIASVRDNKGHLETHVLPVIGPLIMTRVTRAHVESLVAAIDDKVNAGKIEAKTARNVWGTVSKLFDDATNAKRATGLRCLDTNPASDVRSPDNDAPDKLLAFLYPSEFSAFVECEAIPVRWRRSAAIATYLYLRDGEQRAIKWPAIDLEHDVATIVETFDRRTLRDREGTKSGAARIVPIRPELRPLLESMHAEAKELAGGAEPEGYVCDLPSLRDMARGLRRYLTKAGIDRAQLHKTTSVTRQMCWHDLRATGATWMAVEGRQPTEIRDLLGHAQTSTTEGYMRNAALIRGGRFGEVFPPLPSSMLGRLDQRSLVDQPEPRVTYRNLKQVGGADGTRTPKESPHFSGDSPHCAPAEDHRGPTNAEAFLVGLANGSLSGDSLHEHGRAVALDVLAAHGLAGVVEVLTRGPRWVRAAIDLAELTLKDASAGRSEVAS